MVWHPGQHDRRISPPLDFFLWGYVKNKVFSTPVPNITNLKARITDVFCYSNWRHVGEHVERKWLSIRRSPCNKRSICWSVLMYCKKNFLSWVTFWKKNVCIPSSFLVINVCNQGKTLCSPCTFHSIIAIQNNKIKQNWRKIYIVNLVQSVIDTKLTLEVKLFKFLFLFIFPSV